MIFVVFGEMGSCGLVQLKRICCLLVLLIVFRPCTASVREIGTMKQGFRGSQMSWIDNNGLFLVSDDSSFALGFHPPQDNSTLFLLVILHMDSNIVVWTANRDSPVSNSDYFVFGSDGNVALELGGKVVWSPDTGGEPVAAIQLRNSGNLVLLGKDNRTLWESYGHPTDTLLSHQEFKEGMTLSSDPGSGGLSYFLEIKSGDMVLSAAFQTPQTYWSMARDSRKVINKGGGTVVSAVMDGNSWKFYDGNKTLLWQFIFSTDPSLNSTWIAVLGSDGSITFSSLGDLDIPSQTVIPSTQCGKPEACRAYLACSGSNCLCPSGFSSCNNIGTVSPCDGAEDSTELVYAGNGLNYFALAYAQPSTKTNLHSCKQSCVSNCSCLVVFYDNSSGSCFLFDSMGSFQSDTTSNIAAFVKLRKSGPNAGSSGGKHLIPILIIVIVAVLVILGMLYGSYRFYFKKDEARSPSEASDEDNFTGSLSGMPIRYTYKDLQTATDNFSVKLGHGGFGSVYKGVQPDGTRLAVKKLESIGQGTKEFRAEVSSIGSIHHVHLVRLKGFCTEGSHRLLAYEFMANGSLDKWIFKKNNSEIVLDWETRFNIALGTAKGLVYLHEDCDVKIIHCDIKPENVLLDEQFHPKVSDFGLAKLMTREQSHVFTTMRGTRGYLAPEWITNYAISEKSDVYSYGMVLLEIIGGRKNYDPNIASEKSHFPSYAFRMMEEGKLKEIVDSTLKFHPDDESIADAVRVALWCIQEDMSLRPPMSRVVQMLEGVCPIPQPPMSSPMGTRLYPSFFKLHMSDSESGTGTSSIPSDHTSDANLSAVRLSGPR